MNPIHSLAAGIAGAAVLVALGAVVAFTTFQRLKDAAVLREHSRLVLENAEEFFSDLTDAETAERGFALTGDARFLELYEKVKDRLQPELDTLRLLAKVPEALARLAVVAPLLTVQLVHLDRVITLRRTAGFELAASVSVRAG